MFSKIFFFYTYASFSSTKFHFNKIFRILLPAKTCLRSSKVKLFKRENALHQISCISSKQFHYLIKFGSNKQTLRYLKFYRDRKSSNYAFSLKFQRLNGKDLQFLHFKFAESWEKLLRGKFINISVG